MLHQKWTDTFITDFARATINDLADHTDKLLASLNTAEAGLKGAKIAPQTLAMLTAVKAEAAAAVESQRERLERGVLNALSAAHVSRLKKMQDELGSCTEQLILAEAYADKVALLGNKEFKRKLKKVEKMMEGGRSDGVRIGFDIHQKKPKNIVLDRRFGTVSSRAPPLRCPAVRAVGAHPASDPRLRRTLTGAVLVNPMHRRVAPPLC